MLRIVDANLNRVGEGLRVLEDISRFALNNVELSEHLKSLRHDLQPKDPVLCADLAASREAEADVGAFLDIEEEGKRSNLPNLVGANAHRVQQSLRVLEEVCKTPNARCGLDWAAIKRARFELYEIEKSMLLMLLRSDRVRKLKGLYLIMDAEALAGRNAVEVAQHVIAEGVGAIQLRDKIHSKGEALQTARELRNVCDESGTLFIVNDHLDIALACDADGLHVGLEDLPVVEARRLLPQDRILGCSTAKVEEVIEAQAQGADYVAVGSIYPTSSKEHTRPAGLETLHEVREATRLPIVAIGGINEDNIAEVMNAGADAVAVISAVLGAGDPAAAARRLISRTEGG
jgi:thiamine-phosphate pyrophosphorylase